MISICLIYVFFAYINTNQVKADANLRIAFSPFSSLTNQFLNTIQPNNALNYTKMYIYQFLYNYSFPFNSDNAQNVVNQVYFPYLGYIILVILGILFFIFFTLVGLCFCCCRCCCNKCGAKPPGSSEGNTKSRRIFMNVLLLVFIVLITIGAIIAMASNAVLLEALKSSNSTVDKAGNIFAGLDTTISYAANYTNYLANNGLNNGVALLQNTLKSLLSILSSAIALFTSTFLNALNINSIINNTNFIISGYSSLVTQAANLSNTSSLHQTMTAQFTQYLQNVVQNLTTLLNSTACQNFTDTCGSVSPLLPQLVINYNSSNINYTVDIGMPNYFSGFNISNLVNALDQFNSSNQNMTSQIGSTLNGYTQSFANNFNSSSGISQSYNNTFVFLSTIVDNLNNFKGSLYNITLPNGVTLQNDGIYSYFIYVFYGFIALICIIFVIMLFLLIGLCFGVCGGPNFEDSSCCSKGAGSRFLMGGVALSYIFGWLIMLIVTIMFIIGGPLSTEVCRYVTNSGSNYLSTIDEVINATIIKLLPPFKINNITLSIPNVSFVQSILTRCPASPDLISAFQVPSAYISNISGSINQQFVLPQLLNLIQNIKNYTIPSISASSVKNSSDQITSIVRQLNAINTSATTAELSKPVVLLDISVFLGTISNLYQVTQQSQPNFANSLNATVSQLNPMVNYMTALQTVYLSQKTAFTQFASNMTAPLTSLSNAINILSSQASDAKTAAVSVTNTTLMQNTSTLVNQTIFDVVRSLGNCQGLATTFNSAVGILCTTFLTPFNNLWMGIGWFLLFIIPTLVIAVKLHRLYRISHIETYASTYNRAYQNSNNFLSQEDMEMIRKRA